MKSGTNPNSDCSFFNKLTTIDDLELWRMLEMGV